MGIEKIKGFVHCDGYRQTGENIIKAPSLKQKVRAMQPYKTEKASSMPNIVYFARFHF
jgi:hypothetical protein